MNLLQPFIHVYFGREREKREVLKKNENILLKIYKIY